MQRQTNDSWPLHAEGRRAAATLCGISSPRLKSMARWTLAMVAALVGVALALPVQAQTQWKWRDKTGRTQYSDLPPPSTVPEQDILARPAAAAKRAAAAASAPPAPFMAGSGSAAAARRGIAGFVCVRAEACRPGARGEKEEGRSRSGCEGQGRGSQDCSRQGRELRPRARSTSERSTAECALPASTSNGEREILDDKQRADETQRTRDIIAADCK